MNEKRQQNWDFIHFIFAESILQRQECDICSWNDQDQFKDKKQSENEMKRNGNKNNTNERKNGWLNQNEMQQRQQMDYQNKWFVTLLRLPMASYPFKWKCFRIGQIQIVIAYKLCWWGNLKSDLKKCQLLSTTVKQPKTLYKHTQIIVILPNGIAKQMNLIYVYNMLHAYEFEYFGQFPIRPNKMK